MPLTFFQPATSHPRIKICGFTSAENAAIAIDAGADAVGLNFWPKSKRYLAPADAEWAGALAGSVTRIGLFVNASIEEEIEPVIDLGILDAIQLHGDESPDAVDELSGFGLPIIKAIGVSEAGPASNPSDFPTPWILLDAWAPEERGGTGKTFRWDLFREAQEANPEQRFILAGGITPDNVAEAIAATSPHGIDTASGVESAPAIKDPDLVRKLVEEVSRQT